MSRLKKLFTPKHQREKNTFHVLWQTGRRASAEQVVMNVSGKSQHGDESDAVDAEPVTQSSTGRSRDNVIEPGAERHSELTPSSEVPVNVDKDETAGPASRLESDAVVAVDVTTVAEQEIEMKVASETAVSSAVSAHVDTVRCSVLC